MNNMFTVFGFIDNNTAFPEQSFDTIEEAKNFFDEMKQTCIEVNLWEELNVVESFNKENEL
tara:strand:+ start:1256 stop:1438 length:183 start_codon:yes stop_codon:yes gene_type:complete